MAKNRLFELPQTRGEFQIRGKVQGVEKENFYKEIKTKGGSDFRVVNFGVTYDDKATVYMNLNGMPRDKVHFSKRNPETKKTETKPVDWADRNKFAEEGYNLIGISCGIQQVRNEKGKIDNVIKTLVEYDACEYLNAYLEDDLDVYIRGNVEFNSFTNKNGDVNCRVNYKPSRIYACKQPIDFDDENYEPQHDFKQTIVFKEINKEYENEKETGRFVVSAWIVNYASIENADFIIEDKGLANLFKKNLKSNTAINVWGNLVSRTVVEEVATTDCWGQKSAMDRVNNPTVREMIITGADPSTIDKDTYSEKEMNAAFEAIRKSKNAEENFEAGSSKSDWGSSNGFDSDEDTPW